MSDEHSQTKEVLAMPKRSAEFSETLAREMALTTETFQVQLTELMMVGYSEALAGMTPKGLSLGFRRARRTWKFKSLPPPAVIRECAEAEAETCKTYYQGLPSLPPPTEAEKAAEREMFKSLCKRFGWKEGQ